MHASMTFRDERPAPKPVLVEESGEPLCALCWDYFQKVERPTMELQDKFCSQCIATDYVGCLREQQRWCKEQRTIVAAMAMQGEKEFQLSLEATVTESSVYFYDHKLGNFGFCHNSTRVCLRTPTELCITVQSSG